MDLELITKQPHNLKILDKMIKNYAAEKDVDEKDVLYELAFFKTQHNFKETVDFLRSNELGFKHPSFQPVSKRIDEMDHFMDKPFEVVEGVNTCGNAKCGGSRTLSYSRQTRGGDEGMTVYVFCIDCKFRYIMNS